MNTVVIKIVAEDWRDEVQLMEKLQPAVQALKASELVAFPTETVYGLAGISYDQKALRRIFKAKGRPVDNPLISHVNSVEEMEALAGDLSPLAKKLVRHFSPGPISYILPKKKDLPRELTAGLDTVAVRIPSNRVARALIKATKAPLAAPSANLSGSPSPTSAEHVYKDLAGKIAVIIDAGSSDFGLESSVIDLSNERKITLLRPGAVTAEALVKFLEGEDLFQPDSDGWRSLILPVLKERELEIADVPVKVDHSSDQTDLSISINSEGSSELIARSPGMKYRHYAPQASVVIVPVDSKEKQLTFIKNEILNFTSLNKEDISSVSLYISNSLYDYIKKDEIISPIEKIIQFKDTKDSSAAARELFAAFRTLDEMGTKLILAQGLAKTYLGVAYMNRLEKAASNRDKKVIFVCTGNTCRSPVAEAIFNKQFTKKWTAMSYGLAATPATINPYSQRILERDYDLELNDRVAKQLTIQEVKVADLILTMTASQASYLRNGLPQYATKIFSVSEFINAKTAKSTMEDISDPYGCGLEQYELMVKDIAEKLEQLYPLLELI